MTMSILELLQHIVNEPAPRLTEGRFPTEAENFVDSCLLKDPDERKTPKDLLVSFFVVGFTCADLDWVSNVQKDIWIDQARVSPVDVKAWANTF